MASAARQRLMNEYRAFEKEKWVNIEVCEAFDVPSTLDTLDTLHAI
jgi:hypothetical protein